MGLNWNRLRIAPIPYVALEQTNLTANDKILIAAISAHGEKAFPFTTTLMRLTSMKRRAVFESLKHLQGAGWLEIEHRHDKQGHRTSSNYILGFPDALIPYLSAKVQPAHLDQVQPAHGKDLIRSESLNSERKEDKIAAGRRREPKYPPDIYGKSMEITKSMRTDISAIEGAPPPNTFGRDLAMVCKMVAHYGSVAVEKMAREFFAYRESRGWLCSIPAFYKTQEILNHVINKRREHAAKKWGVS